MMEKTALGIQIQLCRTSLAEPSDGSSVAKRASRRKSEAQITFPRHHHRSLQAPRSHKASHALITSWVHRILARDPADNQYP
jgi:hypothetical protein